MQKVKGYIHIGYSDKFIRLIGGGKVSGTITANGDGGVMTKEVRVIGRMDHTKDHTLESANRVYDAGGCSPTLNTCGGGGLQPKVVDKVRVRQSTKQGYVECDIGGVANLSFPDSKDRRGRVQGNGQISPTLTTSGSEVHRIEGQYRIRKLTALECFRLMGVTDEDAKKMMSVNSESQCYKQAGNSIVVQVLEAIFERLNIEQC